MLAELSWQAERRHGDEIFPMLERLLELGRVPLAEVDRIAVAVGPGSFTGVRIALSVAQGLARGRGAAVTRSGGASRTGAPAPGEGLRPAAPLLLAGVGTLDIVAYPHASRGVAVCALLPAGGDDHYAAFFGERDGEWRRTSPYLAETLADLATHVGEPTLFSGELEAETEATLVDLLGERALFPAPSARVRRAGYLAELGWHALEAGRATPLDKLEPIYVKPAAVRAAAEHFAGRR